MKSSSKYNTKRSNSSTPTRKGKNTSSNNRKIGNNSRNNAHSHSRNKRSNNGVKLPIFSWVHLSDIHFRAKTENLSTTEIRTSLPRYLKEIDQKNKINAIIITGDFRHGKHKDESTANSVYKYIKQISNSLMLNDNDVFIVPGNHDLDRSPVRDYILQGILKNYDAYETVIDKRTLSKLTNDDFKFYESLRKHFNQSLAVEDPHRLIELKSCNLLLLDTALTAGTDSDECKLIIGNSFLKSFLNEEGLFPERPTIAIGHHGLELLHQEERAFLTQFFLTKGVNLYLCGHVHNNWIQSFDLRPKPGQHKLKGRQVNVGCIVQDRKVTAGFSVGTLYSNGDVMIQMYKWNNSIMAWEKDKPFKKTFLNLYDIHHHSSQPSPEPQPVEKADFGISLKGSRPIGDEQIDILGRKYVWKKHIDSNEDNSQNEILLESVINNRRFFINSKDKEEEKDNINTSRYKISTSIGCPLHAFDSECVFCEVGTNKYYPLTAEEIALQCIFMAEYDSQCKDHDNIINNQREFAFMGQGEPGFNYPMVKRAILLTDLAMKEINQTVSGYIIYTSGITDFIPSLIDDYKSGVFNKNNLHVKVYFSLNAIEERDLMMPINKMYPYQDFIHQCKALYQVTKEKIEVGILMMSEYSTSKGLKFSLTPEKFEAILNELNKEAFSIDLCLVNKTTMGKESSLDYEEYRSKAEALLKIAKENEFTCKLFKDFGAEYNAACGQITTEQLFRKPKTSKDHYSKALELLEKAKKKLYYMSMNID